MIISNQVLNNDLIFSKFQAMVKKNPKKIALYDGKRSFSYQELFDNACKIAATLKDLDVKNRIAFILGSKSAESIMAIIGALFSGYSYVALDINQPASRLDSILSFKADSVLILTEIGTRLLSEIKKMKGIPKYFIDLAKNNSRFNIENSIKLDVIDKLAFPESYSNENIAYILFTSGSTGYPKGVSVSHRAAVAALEMFQNDVNLQEDDQIANQVALCFDLSVFDIFGTLGVGASLILIPPEITALPDRFFKLLRESKATSLFTTPSTMDFLLKNKMHAIHNCAIKQVLFSGEPVHDSLLETLFSNFPTIHKVWNLYGATEIPYALAKSIQKLEIASINTFLHKDERVKIKLKDATFDSKNNAFMGELLIGGPTVFTSYLQLSPIANGEVHEQLLSPLLDEAWYPTGDLASINSSNHITLHGRKDRQIKMKGHRFELDEIEAQLANYPDVQDAAVIFSAENQEIYAYIILKEYNSVQMKCEGENITAQLEIMRERIEAYCESKIPKLFCPTKFNFIDKIPYTSSGKKDRKALTIEFFSGTGFKIEEALF